MEKELISASSEVVTTESDSVTLGVAAVGVADTRGGIDSPSDVWSSVE